MKDIVIFDLDGTLALINHRRHFVERPKHLQCDDCGNRNPSCANCCDLPAFKPDWDAFHAACVDDAPNKPIITTLQALYEYGFSVWVVSGRSDIVRPETERQLNAFHAPIEVLIMRKHGDYTPDDVLKKKWLDDGTIPKDRVAMVFDDRQRVVDMWRKEGLTCLQVAPGDF